MGMTSLSLQWSGRTPRRNAAHSLAQVAVDESSTCRWRRGRASSWGPPATCTARARRAAHSSYSPAPRVEFHQAPEWVARLPLIAGKVAAPIHHVIAELDVLWDSSDEAFAEFAAQFRPAQVCTERLAGAGHSIDHHLAAAWFHLGNARSSWNTATSPIVDTDASCPAGTASNRCANRTRGHDATIALIRRCRRTYRAQPRVSHLLALKLTEVVDN